MLSPQNKLLNVLVTADNEIISFTILIEDVATVVFQFKQGVGKSKFLALIENLV